MAAPQLPEVDAEFAKSLGVADGDLAKMRAEVKANLEREVKARLKSARQGPGDAGAARRDDDRGAARRWCRCEIERLRRAARQDLAQRGIQVKDDTPLPAEMFEQQAQRRVNLGLILAELVKAHKLQAQAGAGARAGRGAGAELRAAARRSCSWFYAAPERLREIESMVLEENVVDVGARRRQGGGPADRFRRTDGEQVMHELHANRRGWA